MDDLGISLRYEWKPYIVNNRHLSFDKLSDMRLQKEKCSHWGAAIYKWEGVLHSGLNKGKIGILIGETSNIRQRINQYKSGTQKRGNLFWRENFLKLGIIYLYTLNLEFFYFKSSQAENRILPSNDFSSNNQREIIEQLLVMHETEKKNENVWIVNRKL